MDKRIIEVDAFIRRDHYYLTPEDKCYFYGEYTAGVGYTYSETNRLISNFKKEVDRKGKPEWQYKERAIKTAADIFVAALSQEAVQSCTLIPIPPSKVKTHPLYDDRLWRMLQKMCVNQKCDIREMVVQRESMNPSHGATEGRPTPDMIAQNYSLDQNYIDPPPRSILIFDDVLTTGAHFKAMQQVIRAHFPQVNIFGIFIARRVPKSVFDDFQVLGDSE